MKETRRGSWRWLMRKLRAQFIAGLLIAVPIGATILILVWIFSAIDGILQPLLRATWGHYIPGVGFGITIALIYIIGAIASNVIGKRLIYYGEHQLARVPLIRPLYTTIKQMLEGFSEPGKTGFMEVVLVEFPRKGMKSIGFITNEFTDRNGEKLFNILVPTSPNPTTGFLQIAKEEEIIRTKLSVDDALKMVVSAGRVTPKGAGDKLFTS